MSGCITKFTNCRLLRHGCLVHDDLLVENGRIISPEHLFYERRMRVSKVIDCGGCVVAPGFIDLQINGGFGYDFSHDAADADKAVATVAHGLLAHGVTAFLPTVVTSPPAVYRQVLPSLAPRAGGPHGAAVLGAHLEGPFINKCKRGAHPEEHLCSLVELDGTAHEKRDGTSHCSEVDADGAWKRLVEVYGDLSHVALVTLAPELAGAVEVIRRLRSKGIVVSLGHSDGSLTHAERALTAGASMMTHLFNAMTQFHHRDPGLVGLLASHHVRAPGDADGRPLFFGIIADGIHTHPAALRIAYRTLSSGLCLVTDAVSAMGLPAGRHHIGQLEVHVERGRALVAGTNTLCGSIVTMNECVRQLISATGCSLAQALQAASLRPAEALGCAGVRGTLSPGAAADIVLVNDSVDVLATFIAGQCVYTAEDQSFHAVSPD